MALAEDPSLLRSLQAVGFKEVLAGLRHILLSSR